KQMGTVIFHNLNHLGPFSYISIRSPCGNLVSGLPFVVIFLLFEGRKAVRKNNGYQNQPFRLFQAIARFQSTDRAESDRYTGAPVRSSRALWSSSRLPPASRWRFSF